MSTKNKKSEVIRFRADADFKSRINRMAKAKLLKPAELLRSIVAEFLLKEK